MKSYKTCIFIMLIVIFNSGIFMGCGSSGPENAIKGAANALEQKNVEEFTKHVDISRTVWSIGSTAMKEQKTSFNKITEVFGSNLGSSYMESMMPDLSSKKYRSQMATKMRYAVSTGQLIMESKKIGSPWDPEILSQIKVEKTDQNSIAVPVDSTIGIRTWLSLRKNDDNQWKIIGFFQNQNEAEYWGSDKRIADLKAENERRIAKVKEFNKKSIEKWEAYKIEYKKLIAQKEAREAMCLSKKQELRELKKKVVANVSVEILDSKIEPNGKSSWKKIITFNPKFSNKNDQKTTIETISLSIIDENSKELKKSQGFSPSKKVILEPGANPDFSWSIEIGYGFIDQKTADNIVAGKYQARYNVESIWMQDKIYHRSGDISYSDLPEDCKRIMNPIRKLGSGPILKKAPVLLEI